MTRPTKKVVRGNRKSLKVAIFGSGWSGKRTSQVLKERGHKPFVFERGKDGPAGTSTKYSCHTHPTGSHYNRLPERYIQFFVENYTRFKNEKPKYLRQNPNSIHGIVYTDAQGRPSRTTPEKFEERSKLDPTSRPINLEDFNLQGFQVPVAINEERIINGEELKEQFRLEYLEEDIPFFYDTPVTEVVRVADGYRVTTADGFSAVFDKVVNATGFQKFIPENFKNNPFGLEVIYQPVVGLIYEDTKGSEKDIFSLLLLDGENPCLMPTANPNEYLLTHCGYTLLASCSTPEEAWSVINSVTTDFIRNNVKPKSEADLARYVNDFFTRFKPIGYNGGVIAKPKTENEFRLGFAFESPDPNASLANEASNGIIHVFPGKITSSLRAADEVVQLVEGTSLVYKDGYKCPKNGMLDLASQEIANKPVQSDKFYACTVNNHPELLNKNRPGNSTNQHRMWKSQKLVLKDESISSSYDTRSRRSSRSNSMTDDIGNSLLNVKF